MYDLVTHSMNLVHVALLIHAVRCVDINVQIKSFDIQLFTNKKENTLSLFHKRAQTSATNLTTQQTFRTAKSNVTFAEAKCRSQVPDKKQVDAILSDMRNQLTLVFVKVNQFISAEVTRVSRKFLDAALIRRALETRFKVSHRKRRLIFDEIFHNMSSTYRNAFSSSNGVFRTAQSECHNVVSRQLWNVLEYSLLELRHAMRTSMTEYLKEQSIAPESALGKKVNKMLSTEIRQIRSNQINMLCEKFQMCNGTMLQEYAWSV